MINKISTGNSAWVHSLCAIVFILFTFSYLYFFQADLLSMEQHHLSGGTTRYNRTIGAVIITLILYLLQTFVKRIVQFHDKLFALTYLPSLLLLILLTNVQETADGIGLSTAWLVIVAVILICFIIYSLMNIKKSRFIRKRRNQTFKLSVLWQNTLILASMLIFTCLGGNTDKVFHYRLRMERLFYAGEYDKALEIGEKSHDTDINLTMLRIFALSKSRQLGERLFEYPLAGGSDALLPDEKNVSCLFYPNSEIFKNLGYRKKGRRESMDYLHYLKNNGLAFKQVTDYILCGYLLDKKLDYFVQEIRHRYNLNSSSLPKHYKEALTLYMHLRSNPITVYHDEVMDTDYSDFQKIMRKYKNKNERMSRIRDMYGDTYWFYYYFASAN